MNAVRCALPVLHGHLRLAIRAQPGQRAGLPLLAQGARQTVRQVNGHRHVGRGFVAGEAEHHALIPGSLLGLGHPGVNVGTLGTDVAVQRMVLRTEVLVRSITDALQYVFHYAGIVHPDVGAGRDFPQQKDMAGFHRRFTCYPGHGIHRQVGVQHGVTDLVTHFVGMALAHGFAGEEISGGRQGRMVHRRLAGRKWMRRQRTCCVMSYRGPSCADNRPGRGSACRSGCPWPPV